MTTRTTKPVQSKAAGGKGVPKTGRPSKYTNDLAEVICARIADGESVRTICADAGMPGQRTIYSWLDTNDAFRQQYVRARELQADKMADDILRIADDGRNDTYKTDAGAVLTDYDVIARSKLRVDARKWLASKLFPKKYGDRVQTELTGEGGGPVQFTLAQALADLNGRAAKD